jgi:hypothetical protein
VTEFRRDVWKNVWHLHEQCKDYPLRNFAVSVIPPCDDELCPVCASLSDKPDVWQERMHDIRARLSRSETMTAPDFDRLKTELDAIEKTVGRERG